MANIYSLHCTHDANFIPAITAENERLRRVLGPDTMLCWKVRQIVHWSLFEASLVRAPVRLATAPVPTSAA